VDRVTVMASMAFTGRKKLHGLFGAFRLDAPFLCAGYDHCGVEGLSFWFKSGLGHGGFPTNHLRELILANRPAVNKLGTG
jgi:hypothetical protein